MDAVMNKCTVPRRSLLGLALSCGVLHAAPLPPDVLARPALAVQHPERAVMLGAAMAGARLVAVGERGVIVFSDDLGRSWKQVPSPVSVTLTNVRFADANHGVAVGHSGMVLTTDNGGLAWTQRLDGRRVAALVLEASRQRSDAALAAVAKRLIAEGPDKPFLDVHMADPNHIQLVGAYGLALSSTDAGAHWSVWMDRLDNPKSLHYYALRRRGDVVVVAGEQGLVLRSDDGGNSFRRVQTPYRGSFFTAELPGDREMVVAGLRGNAWLSSDGGVTWAQLLSPTAATINASHQSQDGALFFADQAGFVLKRTGERLATVNDSQLAPITAMVRTGDRRFVAFTMQGVAVFEARHTTL
jgi:photosystem II stability/assembly factor-like uncharacterized protein